MIDRHQYDCGFSVSGSNAHFQYLPSYWDFSYFGRGVSLHCCYRKAQSLPLTLDVGYILLTDGCSSVTEPQLSAPVNWEYSAMPTGMASVSFHSNPKERQYERILKLLHSCLHLMHFLSNTQNSPRPASTICDP